jgi:hypothetical protein
MVFFLASVELGLSGIDRVWKQPQSPTDSPANASESTAAIGISWRDRPAWFRSLWLIVAVLLALACLDLWIAGLGRTLAEGLVAAAYNGQAPPPLSRLFPRIAQDGYKTPLHLYLDKIDVLFGLRVGLAPVLASATLALWKIGFPSNFASYPGKWLRRWGPLLAAGCVLGLATSIRILPKAFDPAPGV